MTEQVNHPVESFEEFSHRRAAALLAIVVVLGGAALSLMLSPSRAFFQTASQVALGAVGLVMLVTLVLAVGGKRWGRRDPRAVQVVANDEWRRETMLRASRVALITALVAQYPLVLLFGFWMELPAPRGAFAMAAATVTLGLATLLATFLRADRD